jgi:formylglycine-generating enzyme required for sulfatase activity
MVVSRIFLSHSTANSAEAIAVRDWLIAQGWNDVFLDLDPERGLVAGQRWQAELRAAVDRCELVIFLLSPEWAASTWCKAEFLLTKHGNRPKAIIPVVVAPISLSSLPNEMTGEYQIVDLTKGYPSVSLPVTPPQGDKASVAFSAEGLQRLKIGVERGGVDPKYFPWPPANDPNRPPYRGLKPLEAEDAGIFFGRDAPVIGALDLLRGLREAPPPRLLVILGASGAGKSSFLRAGLYPRLARNDQHFLPLPVIRPERAALYGETGLLRALEGACEAGQIATSRADLRAAIQGGATKLQPVLQSLIAKATPIAGEADAKQKPPTLIISIDQGEELFFAEAQEEAHPFLVLLRDLVATDTPAITAVFSMRSDNYERLQEAEELEGIEKVPFDLGPMPKGSYAEVIKGPARRLEGTARALRIDDDLVQEALTDIEAGGAKDALPLLAFTLERLYGEYGTTSHLKLQYYNVLGRIKGSIEAAVDRAFKAADADPKVPKDKEARLALVRRGLIPWLAGIDPDTGAPRRSVARLSEIPAEARPMIQHLVEQRLLATDVSDVTGETTIEPAHEALLRQWGLLQGWLKEDTGLLAVLDGMQRASRDWAANGKASSWLAHSDERLRAAEWLLARHDLAAKLEPTDKDYVAACQRVERAAQSARRRAKALVGALGLLLVAVGAGWWQQGWLQEKYQWRMVMGPSVLTAEREKAAEPGSDFKECAEGCPTMIVVPAGKFIMGSPDGEGDADERPQHEVTIAKAFAVGKTDVTFAEWDACVAAGACPKASDNGLGLNDDDRPVINVSWDEAKQYVTWLSRATGRDYRLLTEAEWEYAARAGNPGRYSFGDDETQLGEHAWFSKNSGAKTHPVGTKKPNAFGLYDMHGNVWQWVEDCYKEGYNDAPTDGSAVTLKDCSTRVLRGGSWVNDPVGLRSASRFRFVSDRRNYFLGCGLRVGRTLRP